MSHGALRTETATLLFITSLASSAALMEANSRVMVQVLLLALVVQVAQSQHWSYGWLPGGKRSVGELEATIRVNVLFYVDKAKGNVDEFMKFKTKCNRKPGQFSVALAFFSSFFFPTLLMLCWVQI